MNAARRNVAVVTLDGILYAIAGIDGNDNDLDSVERFNYDTSKWEMVASLSNCKGRPSLNKLTRNTIATLDSSVPVTSKAFSLM